MMSSKVTEVDGICHEKIDMNMRKMTKGRSSDRRRLSRRRRTRPIWN